MLGVRRLFEDIRRIARTEVERVVSLVPQPRMGNIVEWDPKTHRARVQLQPDGVPTNWIPVASHWIGNGWGAVTSHSKGDQVIVVFPEYGPNQGVVIGRLFDQRNPPPQVNSDVILVNSKGSWVALKDGKLGINGVAEVDMTGPTINITALNGGTVNVKADAGTVNVDGTTVNVGPGAESIVLAGGGPAVARVGDTVVCPAGTGHITAGSAIVQSG